jgi:cation-transporting P-type ATPase I
VHRPENVDLARRVEDELARLNGVDWAEVNVVLGRVMVAFDGGQLGVVDLIGGIEGAEEAYGVALEGFPADRPDHPADAQTLMQQVYAIGTELADVGPRVAGRVIQADPLLSEVASLVSPGASTSRPGMRNLCRSGAVSRWLPTASRSTCCGSDRLLAPDLGG